MAYNDIQLDVIDARVAKAVSFTRAMGTVVSRDPNSNRAMVTFEGGTLAVPVKVAGNLNVRQDDRVGLDLYGSEWVITFTFGSGTYNEDGVRHQYTTSYNTSSTTYEVVPEVPALSFVKDRGAGFTRLRVDMDCGAWTQTAGTTGRFGLRGTLTPGGSTADYDISNLLMNAATHHYPVSDHRYLDGMFEGLYTFQAVWRRSAGTGAVTADTNDYMHFAVREVPLPRTG